MAAATVMAASPWAPLAALGSEHQVLLYNTDSGQLLGVLPFREHDYVHVPREVLTEHIRKASLAFEERLVIEGGWEGRALVIAVEVVQFAVTRDLLESLADALGVDRVPPLSSRDDAHGDGDGAQLRRRGDTSPQARHHRCHCHCFRQRLRRLQRNSYR